MLDLYQQQLAAAEKRCENLKMQREQLSRNAV
jgi:hypothetical protein